MDGWMLLKGGIIPSDGLIHLRTIKHFAGFDGFRLPRSQWSLHAEQLQDDWIHCSPTLSGVSLIIPTAVILELLIYEMRPAL